MSESDLGADLLLGGSVGGSVAVEVGLGARVKPSVGVTASVGVISGATFPTCA